MSEMGISHQLTNGFLFSEQPTTCLNGPFAITLRAIECTLPGTESTHLQHNMGGLPWGLPQSKSIRWQGKGAFCRLCTPPRSLAQTVSFLGQASEALGCRTARSDHRSRNRSHVGLIHPSRGASAPASTGPQVPGVYS